MAKDGSTLNVSRSRLIPVGETLPQGMKLARSVNDAKNGVVDKIKDYIANYVPSGAVPKPRPQNVYVVKWKTPEGEGITTHEPIAIFKRQRRMNKLTKEERAFWGSRSPPAEVL
jgi:hypothetical protein